MNGLETLRIRPLDVLHLRGNRLFEGSGDGVAIMPPWPSMFAGAIRTRMLADADALGVYGNPDATIPAPLANALGANRERRQEGAFGIAFVCLERAGEVLVPAPADLVVFANEGGGTRGDVPVPDDVVRMVPRALPAEIRTSGPPDVPCVPVLPSKHRRKPSAGWWLRPSGLAKWQRGETPAREDLEHARALWDYDPRLGIAIDQHRRTVREGLLYTSRSVALKSDVSFVVGIRGGEGCVPKGGLLRLGGDGRGATIEAWEGADTTPPWGRLPCTDRFTVWLVSPGAFAQGWRLPSSQGGGTWAAGSIRARVVAVSIPRYEVVSGWDLAGGKPKPALRVVPAGAVYWLERTSGDLADLSGVTARGLGCVERDRDIEGFGAAWFGEWRGED